MPLVNVMVNGRAYTIACDEGEEEHLRELATHVDEKVRELLSSVGQVGEPRLLLMAALLIADEHHDATQRLAARTREVAELRAAQADAAQAAGGEDASASLFDAAAQRLEDIAARLAAA
jgi:cell division protein ZapA